MIANETACITNSLWTATANATPPRPPLTGDAEAEVAIVGGGYTGLSAAVHLAEAGIRATVLEAESPGWGASGRNGGQVNPGLKEDPDTIEARFGPDMGGRMVALSGGAGGLVFDLVRRLGIDCAAVQAGWLQPVHDAKAEQTVRARVAQWQRRGQPLRMLSRADTAAALGTDAYIGAMLDPRGGNLHPLNYALGLADAAIRFGAAIHGDSRVLRIDTTAPDRHVLHTASGRLTAAKVLICTNAYSDAATGEIARTMVPVRSVQVATDILPEALQRSILPQGQSASDSRRLLLYFRKDAAGRFIMGGRGDYTAKGTERQMQVLREASVRLYPGLAGARWAYHWGGFVALTQDHYPHLDNVRPGVMAGLGFNGRGVAMGTALGKELAAWAAGRPQRDLDFPVTPPRPIPFHILRKPAVTAAVTWSRLRDGWG